MHDIAETGREGLAVFGGRDSGRGAQKAAVCVTGQVSLDICK